MIDGWWGVVAACAQAVAALHEAGVVHGDLKPSNVRLDAAGRVCILDVESALVDWQRVAPAERSRVMHTRGYAAPEVEDGVDCTPASDVYSLGVMLRDDVSACACVLAWPCDARVRAVSWMRSSERGSRGW